MGSRGMDSGTTSQINYLDVLLDERVRETIRISSEKREKMQEGIIGTGAGGGAVLKGQSISYRRCACCKDYSIITGILNYQCPECGWIDDPYQNTHPDSLEGQNLRTLNQAREAYASKNN